MMMHFIVLFNFHVFVFKIECSLLCILQHSAILNWPTPECEMVAYR